MANTTSKKMIGFILLMLFLQSFIKINADVNSKVQHVEKDNNNIIYYGKNIEEKLNMNLNIQAKQVVLQLDILLDKMGDLQEKQYIEDFKEKFVNKYFYHSAPIEDIHRNINKILNERSNKKLIEYEREINKNRQILK